MADAVRQDLSCEELVGLVYPSYDFAPPPAVQQMLPLLTISPKAYVFFIITCKTGTRKDPSLSSTPTAQPASAAFTSVLSKPYSLATSACRSRGNTNTPISN